MNSKAKGCRGERELATILREYGYDSRRGQQFSGGPDSPDVIGLPGIHIECKRVETLNIHEAMKQAIRDAAGRFLPAVFHRRNRGEWLVTMRLKDWMEIYKKWQEME